MRVLLDNGAPRGIASALQGHTVTESRSLGWDELKNGDLLDAAEAAGFEVSVTTDKNIRYQQNLSRRKISIVVLGRGRWRLIRGVLSQVVAAVNAATPGSFMEVGAPDE
jgi:hypothetical protein